MKEMSLYKMAVSSSSSTSNSQAIYSPWYKKKEDFKERDLLRKYAMKWK